QGTFTRVGGSQPVTVDVRVIAATNRDLDKSMQDGTFRPDLYFRLNVVAIHLPPLRERRDDLPALIRPFIARKSAALGVPEMPCARGAPSWLLRYAGAGTVRGRENAAAATLPVPSGASLTVRALPRAVTTGAAAAPPPAMSANRPSDGSSLSAAVDELE